MWKLIRRNKTTVFVFAFLAFVLLYYLWLHHKPFTQDAFVVANYQPVTPLVNGFIDEIYVRDNQLVKKGEKLFAIFSDPYRYQVDELKASLATCKLKNRELDIEKKSAQLSVEQAKVQLENHTYLYNQAQKLYEAKTIAQRAYEIKLRQKQLATINLDSAKMLLGKNEVLKLENQSNIQKFKAQLAAAELNLKQTVVCAPADGRVCNMNLIPGSYVKAGQVLFAFVETSDWWIQANLEETSLGGVEAGQSVEVYLWMYPGKTLTGKIMQVGWAVNRQRQDSVSGLAEVAKENQWFMLPQRFPVRIKLDSVPEGVYLHPGASAYVSLNAPYSMFKSFLWRLWRW